MPDAQPYDAPETGGGLVAMYNAASHANAESFPVLKAFQDYIEAERNQARKRVLQLSVFFAVLMVVVVSGFLAAGMAMWRNNVERENKLLEAVLSQRSAPSLASVPAPAPIVQTSPALEESVRQMSRATSELQSSLDKKLDGVSEITAKVHEKVASQDGEMEKLRSEFRRVQEQSEKLNNELVALKVTTTKTALAAAAVVPPVLPKVPPPAEPIVSPTTAALLPPNPTSTLTAAPDAVVTPAAFAAVTPPPTAATAVPKHEPQKPHLAVAPAPVTARDPRFPPAVKDPPILPPGVMPPEAPHGMMATAIPLATKNIGTVPWRVLIPE